jgi:predicted RNase H-like nuclease (RuvC/YqgF family)
VDTDPEIIMLTREVKELQKQLRNAELSLESRRQNVEKRYRAQLEIEDRKAEISRLETEYKATFTDPYECLP